MASPTAAGTPATLADFGHGILDVTSLMHLVVVYNVDFEVLEVSYGDVGTTFEPEGNGLWLPDSTMVQRWKLSQYVRLAPTNDPAISEYVAWPNHVRALNGVETTTGLVIGPTTNSGQYVNQRPLLLDLIRIDHLTACELSIPDAEGRVVLSGYTVEQLDKNGNHIRWLIEPTDLVMSLTSIGAAVVEPPSASVRPDDGGMFRFEIASNPSRDGFRFDLSGPIRYDTRIQVLESSGRLVWESKALGNAETSLAWPGVDRNGRRVPSGTYWARRTGVPGAAKRLVVIR